MTKEQILKKLELYQEKSTSMEAAMSFGVAIKLVLGLDAEQELEEASKDWQPKKGEGILVRDSDSEEWQPRIFFDKAAEGRVMCLNPHPEYFKYLVKWNQYKQLDL